MHHSISIDYLIYNSMVYKIRINIGTFETEKIVYFINNHSTNRKTLQENISQVNMLGLWNQSLNSFVGEGCLC